MEEGTATEPDLRSQAERRLPGEPGERLRRLLVQVDELQNDFEELLLDQNLWTSVDLLQNIGFEGERTYQVLVKTLAQAVAETRGAVAAVG